MSTTSGAKSTKRTILVELDAANPKSYSRNVHPYPTDIASWVSGGHQQTIIRDTTMTSPVGQTPMKITTSGTSSYSGSYHNSSWNLAPAKAGDVWTVSFWVKANSAISIVPFLFEANGNSNYITTHPSSPISITNEWQRIEYSATFINPNTQYMQYRFDIYHDAAEVWIDGLQIEKGSYATPFNKRPNINGANWLNTVDPSYNAVLQNSPDHNPELGYISFNGVDQYATHTIPAFNTGSGNDYTLEVFFRMNTLATIQYGDNGHIWGGQNGNNVCMYLDPTTATTNRPIIVYDDTRYTGTMRATHHLEAGEWVHWVVIGDGTDNIVQHYINGEPDELNGVIAPSSQYVKSFPNPSYIAHDARWGTYSHMDMAFCRLYDEKLTASEIKHNYASCKSRFA